MLDKKHIQAIFFFDFKMGCKGMETDNSWRLAQELLMNIVQQWFKKCCQGDESFKDEEYSDWPLKVDSDQLRAIIKLILWKLQEKFPRNSTLAILWSFGICSKLERWKGLISRCLRSWLEIKKILVWKCCLLICNNNEPFLDWIVTCNQKLDFTQQLVTTNSVVGPRRSSKALFKAKLALKKGLGHCLMVSDPRQLSES